MSGKQKALLIILAVALVVLFVIAVGVNSGKDEGEPGKSNGFVDWLHKIGGSSSTLDPAKVSSGGGCTETQPHIFQFTNLSECTLVIADPGGLKSLVLESAATFGVTAPAPRDAGFDVSADVKPSPSPGAPPKARASVAVDKATQVRLFCPAAQCVVAVVKE